MMHFSPPLRAVLNLSEVQSSFKLVEGDVIARVTTGGFVKVTSALALSEALFLSFWCFLSLSV